MTTAAAAAPTMLPLETWNIQMKELNTLVNLMGEVRGENGKINANVKNQIDTLVSTLFKNSNLAQNLRSSLSKLEYTFSKMRSENALEARLFYNSQLSSLILAVVNFASQTFPQPEECLKNFEFCQKDDVESVQKFVESCPCFSYLPFTIMPLTSLDKEDHVDLYGLAVCVGAQNVQRYLSSRRPNLNLGIFPTERVRFSFYPGLFSAVGSSSPDGALQKKYSIVNQCLNDGADPLLASPEGMFWLSRFSFSAEVTHHMFHLMLSRVDNIKRAKGFGVSLIHQYTEGYMLKGRSALPNRVIDKELLIARSIKGGASAVLPENVEKDLQARIEARYVQLFTEDSSIREQVRKDPKAEMRIKRDCRQSIEFEDNEDAKSKYLRRWHTRFNENVAVMIYHGIECEPEVTAKVDSATQKACASVVTATGGGKGYAYLSGDQWSNLSVSLALQGGVATSSFPHVYEIPTDTGTKAKRILEEEQKRLPEVINVIKQCFKSVQDPKASSPTADLSGTIASIIMGKLDLRALVADSCYMKTFQKPEWME